MKRSLLHYFVDPHSTDQDVQRREFILNVLLVGLFFVSLISLLASIINLLQGLVVNGLISLVITAVFWVFTMLLWRLARSGHQLFTNYLLLIIVSLLPIWLILHWSYELPIAELCYGLLLVMSGVLLSARSAFRFSVITLVLYLIACYLQSVGTLHPDTGWLSQKPAFGDAIGYAIIFCIISLISWLANREIDRSLHRARTSEAALARERDSLEVKVAERTRELEETQATRLAELERFAEFGRLSANLLHEVANPLTAASLNLEQLDEEHHSKLSVQARANLRRIEQYVTVARKQLTGQTELKRFSVQMEVDNVILTMANEAERHGVIIRVNAPLPFFLYGDSAKFTQILRNLIGNAIESYDGLQQTKRKRVVSVTFHRNKEILQCSVQDWGVGITEATIEKIFDPFYTTKHAHGHNFGIGLSMIKKFVEEDFKGTLTCTSSKKNGTLFEATFESS